MTTIQARNGLGVEVRAVVTRADGSVEDYGTIVSASKGWRRLLWWVGQRGRRTVLALRRHLWLR